MKFKESVAAATRAHRYSPPPILINSNQNSHKKRRIIVTFNVQHSTTS